MMPLVAPSTLILAALVIPPIGACLIALAGRWPNLRESVTLATAFILFLAVVALLPLVMAGETPEALSFAIAPGLTLAFKV